MKILILVGGTNDPSNSATLAEAFAKGAKNAGITVDTLRIKDMNIHHFDLQHYVPESCSDDDFRTLQEKFLAADGVVIASPIWNFSVPAHLKNVIDRLGAVALDHATHSKGQLGGKPFYLIYTGGAPMIAWKALMYMTLTHVSEAIKYYGGIVVGRHFEPKCLPKRGVFGLVVDKRPESLRRVEAKGEKFGKLVAHFAKTKKLPFWISLRYKFFTFAYRVGNRIMYPVNTMQ